MSLVNPGFHYYRKRGPETLAKNSKINYQINLFLFSTHVSDSHQKINSQSNIQSILYVKYSYQHLFTIHITYLCNKYKKSVTAWLFFTKLHIFLILIYISTKYNFPNQFCMKSDYNQTNQTNIMIKYGPFKKNLYRMVIPSAEERFV